MFGLGHTELLIILLLAVVLFGAKRLPEIGRALGRMGHEYRSGKDSAQPPADKDKTQASAQKTDSEDNGFDLEAEIKNQLVSRMPGVGQINRLKRTAEMVGKVTQAVEKTGTGPGNSKDKS